MNERPEHATLLWQGSLIDAAIEREWLVNIGRRSPLERVAHLLCELLVRLEASSVDDADRTRLPIASHELAAAQTLPKADVTAALATLTARRLIEVHDGEITVFAVVELRKVGLFDQNYLER